MTNYPVRLLALLVVVVGTCGCGDPVARHVQTILAGGEGRDEARMELLFAKGEALRVLISALSDTTNPARGRADLVDILWKLHLRESDARIVPAMADRIADPAPEVRAAIAIALTDMQDVDVLPALLRQMAIETDDEVRHQQLKAIEILDGWILQTRAEFSGGFTIGGGDNLTTEQQQELAIAIQLMRTSATKDSLRDLAEEFLAKMAGHLAAEGDRQLLSADVTGSEESYRAALVLRPESEIALQRLGQLLLFNGRRDEGLQMLFDVGIAVSVTRLSATPVLDGDLSDPAWVHATRISDFHQSIDQARVLDATGPTHAWIGYTDSSIWVAVKGHEEDTSDLTAVVTDHDGGVWRDDCVEIFFDVGLDRSSFKQFIVNSLGTMGDYNYQGGTSTGAMGWTGQQRAATRVEPDFWSLEMELPLSTLEADPVQSGDLWGFNIARVRIANGGEYDQWTPTYGFSGRPDRFGVILFE
jgi:hypothetical protein